MKGKVELRSKVGNCEHRVGLRRRERRKREKEEGEGREKREREKGESMGDEVTHTIVYPIPEIPPMKPLIGERKEKKKKKKKKKKRQDGEHAAIFEFYFQDIWDLRDHLSGRKDNIKRKRKKK